MKAGGLVAPVVRQLVQSGRMSTVLATHIMTVVLQGLQVHGQHDANQGSLLMLGTQLYELLRPKYPEVLEVLKQIPEVNPLDLQKLDERMMKEAQKGNKVEKAKKEMFKKITTPFLVVMRKDEGIDSLQVDLSEDGFRPVIVDRHVQDADLEYAKSINQIELLGQRRKVHRATIVAHGAQGTAYGEPL
ncbi:Exportin-5 [Homalodisca vitripennis]|nr:Exportin-5 [Homalodisca vitripennis]